MEVCLFALLWLICGAASYSGSIYQRRPETGHDRAARRERAWYPES